MKNLTKFSIFITLIMILTSHFATQEIFAETKQELDVSFNQAKEHFQNGEYKQAITIYDQILEIKPNHISTLNMKGIVYSNMEDYTKSLTQFFKVLQKNPNDSTALTGMGVGFGNLGEYKESLMYLNSAYSENPNSPVIKNYKEIIENTIKKYPYAPTEKPINYKKQHNGDIPNWVKDITNWWSMKKLMNRIF